MITWSEVTRSLQLDPANLVEMHALLRRSQTLRVLSWLPLTTLVASPRNLAESTLPECPVKVCRSLLSSTVQTLVAKSLLEPKIIAPELSKSIPITAALLPTSVARRSGLARCDISQILIFLSAPDVAKNLPVVSHLALITSPSCASNLICTLEGTVTEHEIVVSAPSWTSLATISGETLFPSFTASASSSCICCCCFATNISFSKFILSTSMALRAISCCTSVSFSFCTVLNLSSALVKASCSA